MRREFCKYGAGIVFLRVAQIPQVPPALHHLQAEQLLQARQGVLPVQRAISSRLFLAASFLLVLKPVSASRSMMVKSWGFMDKFPANYNK